MFIYLVNLKQIAFNGYGDIKSDDGKILQVFYCFAKNGINLSSLRIPARLMANLCWLPCPCSLDNLVVVAVITLGPPSNTW